MRMHQLLGDHRRRGGRRCFQLLVYYSRTAFLILLYYLLSIGLTFYQKALFKEFPFPLTVVIVHLLIKYLLASAWRTAWRVCTYVNQGSLPWDCYIKRVLPAGFAAGLDIGFSQWSLEYITVSLYTMSKSTALVFILGFAIYYKLEEMRPSVVLLVLLITGGLLMFTYKYTQFHLFGFLLIMAASMFSGLRWTLSQLLMQKSELGLTHPVDLVYHIQPFMAITLLPLAFGMEGFKLLGSHVAFNFQNIHVAAWLWYKVLFGAFIAFAMEVSEFYVVSYTSSLTFSISGVAKEVAVLCLSVYLENAQLSLINQAGLAMCVLGISLHVYVKAVQSQVKPACVTSSATGSGGGNLSKNDLARVTRSLSTHCSGTANSDSLFRSNSLDSQPLLCNSLDPDVEDSDEIEMFSR